MTPKRTSGEGEGHPGRDVSPVEVGREDDPWRRTGHVTVRKTRTGGEGPKRKRDVTIDGGIGLFHDLGRYTVLRITGHRCTSSTSVER